jgi:hypothetical protein
VIDGRQEMIVQTHSAAQQQAQELAQAPQPTGYELRFCSLFHTGRAMSFPCDAAGRVDLNALSARGLSNYLFARAVVGREYAFPQVLPAGTA